MSPRIDRQLSSRLLFRTPAVVPATYFKRSVFVRHHLLFEKKRAEGGLIEEGAEDWKLKKKKNEVDELR